MLSCLSASKHSTSLFIYLFLAILQRNSKLVILDNLRLSGYTHLKWKYHFGEAFEVCQQAKNQLHPLHFPCTIAKMLYCCFWYFGHAWLKTPKVILSTCRKLMFISGKKSTSPPMLFWRSWKDVQIYFGYFGYVCLQTPKMIISTCRGLWYLSSCQKIHFIKYTSFTSFLRYYNFKEFCNLIGWQ